MYTSIIEFNGFISIKNIHIVQCYFIPHKNPKQKPAKTIRDEEPQAVLK